MINEVPDSRCPVCNKFHNRASGGFQDNITPAPGDITMCIGCNSVLEFDKDMKLVELSDQDFKALPPGLKDQISRLQISNAILSAKNGI